MPILVSNQHQPAGSLCNIPAPGSGRSRAWGRLEHSLWDGGKGICEHKQEREVEDSPQKPLGWEEIWSWGANTGSSSWFPAPWHFSIPAHRSADPNSSSVHREGQEALLKYSQKENKSQTYPSPPQIQPKQQTPTKQTPQLKSWTRSVHLGNIH